MTGPTHELLGTTAAILVADAAGLPLEQAAALAAVAYATSRLPDRLEGWGIIPHRTITHYAAVGAAPVLAIALITPQWLGAWALILAAGLAIGYLGHIAADSCTPHGTTALWPIYRGKVWLLPKPLRIRTGSIAEKLLAAVTVLAMGAYGYLFLLPPVA